MAVSSPCIFGQWPFYFSLSHKLVIRSARAVMVGNCSVQFSRSVVPSSLYSFLKYPFPFLRCPSQRVRHNWACMHGHGLRGKIIYLCFLETSLATWLFFTSDIWAKVSETMLKRRLKIYCDVFNHCHESGHSPDRGCSIRLSNRI